MTQYQSVETKILVLLILPALFSGCQQRSQKIVDKAIEAHGGDSFHSFLLQFDFRDRHYAAARNGGIFQYSREFTDSTGTFKDVLSNDGLTRYRNGSAIEIQEERKQAYTRSVNSVIYFLLLPFGLNDDAVNKEWVEETTIRGESYQVIRVTFDQKGGGEDHEDVFLYWFHTEKNTMDYFAYSYATDGGGLRFREAINPRRKGGLLLQDYINYRPDDETIPIDSLKSMFIAGKLRKLSEIRLENLTVTDYDEEILK